MKSKKSANAVDLSKNKNVLVFENTIYSLLLYMLYDKDWSNKTYLIFGNRIDKQVINNLSKKVKAIKYQPDYVINKRKNIIKYYLKKLSNYFFFRKFDYCYGNVKNINTTYYKSNSTQLEDGLLTWFDINSDLDNKNNTSKKYLLNGIFKSVDCYQFINIKERWGALSYNEKNDICSIFNFDSNIINNLKDNLLITQPLSEDGFLSEEGKIAVYRKILMENDINLNNLTIKPHPREVSDYHHYFPHSFVISKVFPYELLAFFGANIKKIITLYSSGLDLFDSHSDVIFTGTKILKDMNCNIIYIPSYSSNKKNNEFRANIYEKIKNRVKIS